MIDCMYGQLNSFYDCTETTCGETFHNFLLDSCLLYVLGVLFGLYSVNCIEHMIRHQSKFALQLCGEFHGKHNTIDSSAVFDTMVNGLN